MRDEDRLSEGERRLNLVLRPGDESVARVIADALRPTVRTIGLTASTVLLAACWSFAQATSGVGVEPQEIQKAVIYAQVSSRSASAPLDMRVSVQYVNSKPEDILQVLAKAAGLTVEVSSSNV